MTALKTDLKHQVKQTPLPKWKPLIPVFEAIMNSIQSIADREPIQPGRITIELHRQRDLLGENNAPVESVTVTDNGIGLDDDNFDSFNTVFSDWKEAKGGKGLGRFTWLKAFERIDIDTTFAPKNEELQRRQFEFTETYNAG